MAHAYTTGDRVRYIVHAGPDFGSIVLVSLQAIVVAVATVRGHVYVTLDLQPDSIDTAPLTVRADDPNLRPA